MMSISRLFNSVCMNKKIAVLFVLLLLLPFAANAANKKFVLVIDPGHGGKDAGALGAFSKEKNINLNVAMAFRRNVQRNCPDVKVIYTRTTDVFIGLKERAEIANRNKADLFISVHTNAQEVGRPTEWKLTRWECTARAPILMWPSAKTRLS